MRNKSHQVQQQAVASGALIGAPVIVYGLSLFSPVAAVAGVLVAASSALLLWAAVRHWNNQSLDQLTDQMRMIGCNETLQEEPVKQALIHQPVGTVLAYPVTKGDQPYYQLVFKASGTKNVWWNVLQQDSAATSIRQFDEASFVDNLGSVSVPCDAALIDLPNGPKDYFLASNLSVATGGAGLGAIVALTIAIGAQYNVAIAMSVGALIGAFLVGWVAVQYRTPKASTLAKHSPTLLTSHNAEPNAAPDEPQTDDILKNLQFLSAT